MLEIHIPMNQFIMIVFYTVVTIEFLIINCIPLMFMAVLKFIIFEVAISK